MPPRSKSNKRSSSKSKKAKERKEKKLLEERIKKCGEKCEEAKAALDPTGRNAEPNFVKAKEALDAAIEIYDLHPEPYFLMGECYRLQKQYEEGVDYYSRSLDADSSFVRALEGRAGCYRAMNDIFHAVEDYTSIIGLEPANDHAYNMRGLCYLNSRVPGLRLKSVDFEHCENDFKAAIRLNEANYYALANLGKLYEDQQSFESALDCYTSSLQVKENYIYARFRRGCAALALAENMLSKEKKTAEDDEIHGDNKNDNKKHIPTMQELEDDVRDSVQAAERQKKAKAHLKSAESDFKLLIDPNPEVDKNLADVSVVLNLGVCSLLGDDLNAAEGYFKYADAIIAARPGLVEEALAAPIEDVDTIKAVLALHSEKLAKKKAALSASA